MSTLIFCHSFQICYAHYEWNSCWLLTCRIHGNSKISEPGVDFGCYDWNSKLDYLSPLRMWRIPTKGCNSFPGVQPNFPTMVTFFFILYDWRISKIYHNDYLVSPPVWVYSVLPVSCYRSMCSLEGHMAVPCYAAAVDTWLSCVLLQPCCVSLSSELCMIIGIPSQSSWGHLYKTFVRSSLWTSLCGGKVRVRGGNESWAPRGLWPSGDLQQALQCLRLYRRQKLNWWNSSVT